MASSTGSDRPAHRDVPAAGRSGSSEIRVIPEPRGSLTRVCVIGGGIAGLSAAHAIMRGTEHSVAVTVLEASSSVGGKLRLGEIAGVGIDVGAEAMQATRPEAVALARGVGLERDVVHPEVFGASLWTRGKLRPMPATVMGIPTDLRALTASKVLPLASVMKLPLEYRKPATRFDRDVSVGAFVESRLGRELVDTLVEPVLGGVYAGRADALSLEATVPALFRELRSQASILKAAEHTARGGGRMAGARRGPVFAGIRGGVGRLPQEVANDLIALGARVRTNAPVRSIHRVDDHWRIVIGAVHKQQVIEAEEIVIATPPPSASELLSHVCPPASTDLGLIDMSSMAVVAMAYPAAEVGPMAGSGFLVPPSERRTIKAANYASSKWDWISRSAKTRYAAKDSKVVFRASAGRMGEEAVLDMDDADLAALVHDDLTAAVGISAKPLSFEVTRWRDAIPQYSTGHVKRVERIRANLTGIPGLSICGAAFDGVGVAAVIGSARFAARGVLNRIEAKAAAGPAHTA